MNIFPLHSLCTPSLGSAAHPQNLSNFVPPLFFQNLPSLICSAHIFIFMGPTTTQSLVTKFLKKTDFPSLRSHQLSITPPLEVGSHKPLPLHAGMLPGLLLYRSYASSHGCLELRSSIISRRHCFIQSSVTSGSYALSVPFSLMVPKPWGRERGMFL